MKRVLTAVLVIIGGAIATNYYFAYKIEQQLKAATQTIQALGGFLSYSGVDVTLGGNIEIDNVLLTAPGMDDKLVIKRILVRSGSFFGVQSLASDIRNSRVPKQLGLSFQGMQIPFDNSAYNDYRQINALPSEGEQGLLLAGCGGNLFSKSGYQKMGYGDILAMDSKIDFRVMNEGQWIEVDVHSVIDDMYEMGVSLDLTLNAKSRDIAALGLAGTGATLNKMVMDYQDRGLVRRIIDFCSNASKLPADQFLTKHADAWLAAWKNMGVNPGENLLTAYRQFIQKPEHIQFTIKPLTEFKLTEMANMEADRFPYLFRTSLKVNGNDMGWLEISEMNSKQLAAWRSEDKDSTPSAATSSATPSNNDQDNALPPSPELTDLQNHIQKQVEIQLTNGRIIEGKILEADGNTVLIHSIQKDGSMKIPITYTHIAEVKFK